MLISRKENILGAINDTCSHFGFSRKFSVSKIDRLRGLAKDASVMIFRTSSTHKHPFDKVASSYRLEVEYAVATGILNGLKRPKTDFNIEGRYIDGEQSRLAAPFEEETLGFMRGQLDMMNTTADNVFHRAVRDASYNYPNIKRAGDAMRVIIAAGRIAARHEEIRAKAGKMKLI